MPCYRPIRAFKSGSGEVVFTELRKDDVRASLWLPCGQCVGCRLERSRQWAVRCMHEAQLSEVNSFVTLTYADENMPRAGSLKYEDFQLFMKRLRFARRGVRIRFFMCGEYGEELGRPHYHACLFNCGFPDKVPLSSTGAGSRIYRSAELERLWPFGLCSVGAVSFESAAYVARYSMKKVTGDLAAEHYRVVDLESGEVVAKVPEFARMSLKPGIGAGWLERFRSDVFPKGEVVVRGHESKSPRYYDKLFACVDPDEAEALKYRRHLEALPRSGEQSDERLRVREQVAKAKVSFLKRSLKG